MKPRIPPRFGWHRDTPDPRDYSPVDERVRELLQPLGDRRRSRKVPTQVDWREFFPAVGDESGLSACTAVAAVGLVGYFLTRSFGRKLDGSWMFLYAMARRLLHWKGDSGATLRATWKALVRFGLPPEEYCPLDASRLDEPLDPFLFCYRAPFGSIAYERLDPAGSTGDRTLIAVKAHLAAGFPCAFGFPAFDSLSVDADIPMPVQFDSVLGGQAAVAVGYDNSRRIRSAKGALLIRGSWGESWGDGGYGWLPYAYVDRQLAVDFWTLLNGEWLGSGEFSVPRVG